MYPQMSKKPFYQNYILPYVDSGSVIRGKASEANFEHLDKLQKRAACIILHANYDNPSADMFMDLGWLLVPDRLNYNQALLTYEGRSICNENSQVNPKVLYLHTS